METTNQITEEEMYIQLFFNELPGEEAINEYVKYSFNINSSAKSIITCA